MCTRSKRDAELRTRANLTPRSLASTNIMAEKNFLLPVLLLDQMSQTSAPTETLGFQGVAQSGSLRDVEEDCDDESEEG